MLSWLIVILAMINLLRLAVFMIATDWYELHRIWQGGSGSHAPKPYRPWVSVVIPAHNEELCIERTVESVLANTYPWKEILVVDDGSTDATLRILRRLKRTRRLKNLKVITQRNSGKAAAINNAVRNHARGSLVMVLDADSLLEPRALQNMVRHFADPQVIASAANVKIIDDQRIIGMAQRIEYLLSYRLKRALTVLNMEYIIGGVGSTFRKRAVRAAEFYDTDTITEDIDFTLKLIVRNGNRTAKINYAADAIAYTEAVMSYKALVRQRFRWKYGRMQSFVKHRGLFLSRSKNYDKRLTWINLPYALVGELTLFIEPLLFGFVILMAYLYGDSHSLMSVYAIITVYVALNIIAESTESVRNKFRLLVAAPAAYGLMYVLTVVELFALFYSLRRLPALFQERVREGTWEHVERAGVARPA